MSHSTRAAQAAEESENPTVRLNGLANSSSALRGLLQAEATQVAVSKTMARALKRRLSSAQGPLRNRIAISAPSARPSMWVGKRTYCR